MNKYEIFVAIGSGIMLVFFFIGIYQDAKESMKVIKDTMPNDYETKDGNVGFLLGFSFGYPTKKESNILLPIRPNFVFQVDGKSVGEYHCEVDTTTNSTLSKEEIYKETYKHLIKSLLDFLLFARTQFAIPTEVQVTPPPYDNVKGFIADNLNGVV